MPVSRWRWWSAKVKSRLPSPPLSSWLNEYQSAARAPGGAEGGSSWQVSVPPRPPEQLSRGGSMPTRDKTLWTLPLRPSHEKLRSFCWAEPSMRSCLIGQRPSVFSFSLVVGITAVTGCSWLRLWPSAGGGSNSLRSWANRTRLAWLPRSTLVASVSHSERSPVTRTISRLTLFSALEAVQVFRSL